MAKSPSSKTMIWVALALGIISVGSIVTAIILNSEKEKEIAQAKSENEQLQIANEQLQLANEYQALDKEFIQYEDQIKMLDNDTLSLKYNQAKQKVETLLKELKNEKQKGAQHTKRIKELEGEIATLKGILRHYVAQIDSLGKENEGLRAENKELRSDKEQLQSRVEDVSRQNEHLNERMTLAEKLNVTGVTLTALNKKGKNEKKIHKAKQLMVNFTIPQNNSTPVGMKNIYIRITNPEGDLLRGGSSFTFEGSTLESTASKQIEYQGEEIANIKIYWNVNTTLTPGEYTVELFADNYRLASRRFTMKK